MPMKVIVPKKNDNHVGTPNRRITNPVRKPVTNAFVGKAIFLSLIRCKQGLLHSVGSISKQLLRGGAGRGTWCACTAVM